MSQPGDPYEQEADRVADIVMNMPEPRVQRDGKSEEEVHARPVIDQITPLVQRQVEPDKEEEEGAPVRNGLLVDRQAQPGEEEEAVQAEPEKEENVVQTKSFALQPGSLPRGQATRIQSLRDGGQPLPVSVRAFFEPRFGYNFGRVRVHADARAADATQILHALAFTLGSSLVFAPGAYAPDTALGRRLLAHELAHAVQQERSGAQATAATLLQCKPNKGEDLRIQKINQIIQEEIDSFWPSYKVMLSGIYSARRIGGLQQLVIDLRARSHKDHGTYFGALLRTVKSRGSDEILRHIVKILASEGIAVTESVEEYPLRYQIVNYLTRKIQETKHILIGKPKDSIGWVLKAMLIDTFYTFEEGFVDVLRIGQGSEEAARAYAFEKSAVDRWAGMTKGILEDFLRLTTVFASVEKGALQTTEKQITGQMARNTEEAISTFTGRVDKTVGRAATQAEKQAAKVVRDAANTTRERVKRTLVGKDKLDIEPTTHPAVGEIKTRKPRGFQPTGVGPKQRVKSGTLKGLEPTSYKPTRKLRRKSVTRQQQIEGITFKSAAKSARDAFNAMRKEFAKKLGVGKGGQVHHAVELQVLDRYPGVFSAVDLNTLKKMRGIPAEKGGLRQLHNSKIREIWERHYQLIDLEIVKLGLKPGTAQYETLVRRHIAHAADEIDWALWPFYTKETREMVDNLKRLGKKK